MYDMMWGGGGRGKYILDVTMKIRHKSHYKDTKQIANMSQTG